MYFMKDRAIHFVAGITDMCNQIKVGPFVKTTYRCQGSSYFPGRVMVNSPRSTCIATTLSNAAVKQLAPRFDFSRLLPSGMSGRM
jgi:hypothetical protein